MKKFILFITILFSVNAFSQEETLTIYNFTDCYYEYTLLASSEGAPSCNANYQLYYPIAIGPQTSVVITNGYHVYPGAVWYKYITEPEEDPFKVENGPELGSALARFVGWKTADGANLGVGLVSCGAASNTDSGDCSGNEVVATFQGFGLTKVVIITSP